MADVQPPPLRSMDDFILSSARFAVPDVRDLERLNNRIINNLLYYQSNYFLSVLIFLAIVGYVQPLQLFLGATVVTLAFLGFVWAAENQASIRRFRRTHPSLSLSAILGASYLFLSVLGGVAVFLFGIAFPILRQFLTILQPTCVLKFKDLLNKLSALEEQSLCVLQHFKSNPVLRIYGGVTFSL
uniref:PRA1 family protein n=1 Tax=Paramormyrops kingsleyae TaxID=1676925 RepID=A0A3B3S591_9TELE